MSNYSENLSVGSLFVNKLIVGMDRIDGGGAV